MTCEDCMRAIANPLSGRLTTTCKECMARHLAKSPQMAAALAGEPAELRGLIEQIWKEQYLEGRTAVWRWYEALKAARTGDKP